MGFGVLLEENCVAMELRTRAMLAHDELCNDLVLSLRRRHQRLHVRGLVDGDGDVGAGVLVLSDDIQSAVVEAAGDAVARRRIVGFFLWKAHVLQA